MANNDQRKSELENYKDAMEEFADEKSYSIEDLKRIGRMRSVVHEWAYKAAMDTISLREEKNPPFLVVKRRLDK